MIYYIAILVQSLGLKKFQEGVEVATQFLGQSLLGLSGLPKKFLESRGPYPLGGQGPQNRVFGGAEPHRVWGSQTPNFFWEVQEVPIDFAPKISWLVQLLLGIFLAQVIGP